MLKINLLPSYVAERRRVRQATVFTVIVVLLVLGGMLGWIYTLNQQAKAAEQRAIAEEQERDRVNQLIAEVQAAQAKIPPVEAKVTYINGVLDYNGALPSIYENLVRYIYSRVEVRQMNVSGGSMSMSGHVRTLGDYTRFLMSLYRATEVFSSFTISGVPGWPSPALGTVGPSGKPDPNFTGQSAALPTGLDFTLSCTLVTGVPAAPTYTPGVVGGQAPAPGGSVLGTMSLPSND